MILPYIWVQVAHGFEVGLKQVIIVMPDFISKQEAVPTHELLKEDQDCVICLTTYGHRMSEGTIEHAVRLACGHVAGSLCLKAWLKRSNQCPFCRKELFPQPHQPDDDSEFREVTIDTAELELRSQFDQHRERTSDEVDELEAKALLSPANRVSRGIAGGENIQLWRGPSLRRRADLHSRELYDQVRAHQIRNGAHPPYTLPILEPWEVNSTLGWKSDLALFKYLQKVGAFRLPGMDLERSALPNPSDESLYNQLRNQGVRWHFDLRGWFQFGRRVTFRGLNQNYRTRRSFSIGSKARGLWRQLGSREASSMLETSKMMLALAER